MTPLVIIGLNHNTAAIDFREQLAGGEESNWALMQELKTSGIVSAIVILSTCHRFEIIAITEKTDQLLATIARSKNIQLDALVQRSYCYQKEAALTHLLRVATGLDSMLLGEPQILGQLKTAYQHAHSSCFVDNTLQRIFPEVFRIAKRIRHTTQINHNAVCTAYAVMCLAKSIFKLSGKRILLIGSGEMVTKILAHCRDAQFSEITIANRTYEKAQNLAATAGVHAIPFSDIPHVIARVDIIVTAVQAPLAIIGKGLIERALKQRLHLPLLCVDLGVPRNIEPEVSDVDGVYLYNIDQMRDIVQSGKAQRELAAHQANQILTTQAQETYQKIEALMAVDIVRDFRREVEMLRVDVYAGAIKALAQGNDAAVVIQDALRKLSNKILHKPTVQLRRAVVAKREDVLQLTREFFDL